MSSPSLVAARWRSIMLLRSVMAGTRTTQVTFTRSATSVTVSGTRGGRVIMSGQSTWPPCRFASASRMCQRVRSRCPRRAVGGVASRNRAAASYVANARASSRSSACVASGTGRCVSATGARESGRSFGNAFDQRSRRTFGHDHSSPWRMMCASMRVCRCLSLLRNLIPLETVALR